MQKYPNLWSEQDRARDPATNRKRRRPDLIHNCVDVCSRGKRTPLLLTAYADFCRMRLRRLPGACRRCPRKHESNHNKHSLHFSHKLLLNPMPMFSGELTSQFLLLGSVMLIPRELNETVELLLLYPLESLLNEPADFLDSLRTKRRKTIIDRPPQRWSKS